MTANALLGGAQDLAIVVGPVVAAVVNARWGLAGAFGADAVTYLFGLAVAVPLAVGPVGGTTPQSAWRALREGMDLARRTRGLRWTLAVASVIYLLWALFGVLERLYVRDVWGSPTRCSPSCRPCSASAWSAPASALRRWGSVWLVRGMWPRHDRLRWHCRPLPRNEVAAGGVLRGLPVGSRRGVLLCPAKTLLQRYAPTSAHGRIILSLNQSLEPLTAMLMAPVAAVVVTAVGVQQAGVAGGVAAAVAGLVALRVGRSLAPLPPPVPVDPTSGSSRDAIALGGPAPG